MGLLEYIKANTPRATRPIASPGTVINQGLLNPNQFNAPSANRFKDSLLGLAGIIPGAGDYASGVQAADLWNRGEKLGAFASGLGALPVIPALGGMFIGKGAKTWDVLKAQQAEEMLAKGIDPREVWKQTGTMRWVDKALRQEIPDNLVPTKMDATVENLFFYPKAHEYMDHKPLFDAYPDTQMITMAPGKTDKGGGAFLEDQNVIELNAPYFNNKTLDTNQQAKSTALHEMQHAIQQREGWARGGSEKPFLWESLSIKRDIEDQITAINEAMGKAVGTPKYSELMDMRSELVRDLQKQGLDDPIGLREKAYNKYRNLAGEAEARLTQARMNMTPEERLMSYPYDMLDVPQDHLIIRGLLGQ